MKNRIFCVITLLLLAVGYYSCQNYESCHLKQESSNNDVKIKSSLNMKHVYSTNEQIKSLLSVPRLRSSNGNISEEEAAAIL